jgi:hypothetical protein
MKNLNCDSFDFCDFTLQSGVMMLINRINIKIILIIKIIKITVQTILGIVARLAWESSLDWRGNRHSISVGIVTRLAWESSLDWRGNRRSIGRANLTHHSYLITRTIKTNMPMDINKK